MYPLGKWGSAPSGWNDGTCFWFFGGWDITSRRALHLGDVEFEALFVQEEDREGVGELVVGNAT